MRMLFLGNFTYVHLVLNTNKNLLTKLDGEVDSIAIFTQDYSFIFRDTIINRSRILDSYGRTVDGTVRLYTVHLEEYSNNSYSGERRF